MLLPAADIRERFLRYFERHDHQRLPSSPLIPGDDPTLLFTNAGMNQFKDVFTGAKTPAHPRAVTAQKCMRAGGKHNDLENVGFTRRHHTFFEMLGNFSFGDYFKREAIAFAWEFVTGELRLDPEQLWITIFEDDDEAFTLWRDAMGVRESRIVRMGVKDNFWAMGDTGPCGPCSEIHVDRGEGPGGIWRHDDIHSGSDRFLEIWNLVFMQFEQRADGSRVALPKPSIDTGAGLERLACVSQKVVSNYDTDLFQPILHFIAGLAGTHYGDHTEADVSMRVVADHARAAAFLIADGVNPSNEGRGYTLRRIMRRAIRHGRKLGFVDRPFYPQVCAKVVEEMGAAWPELKRAADAIENWVRSEEEGFRQTLDRGLRVLEKSMESARSADQHLPGAIGGETAFLLYDTYGFPLDLTQTIARERGLLVDEEGFHAEMEKQRARGRASWKGADASLEELVRELRRQHGPTQFVGYEREESESRVVALVALADENGMAVYRAVDELAPGAQGFAALDVTPFYAEGGGQVGDGGEWFLPPEPGMPGRERLIARIADTRKPVADFFLHTLRIDADAPRGLKVGDTVHARIHRAARAETRLNHSATHLMHHALREVLGDHVRQAGSEVRPDRLRFDFTHYEAPTAEQLDRIEHRVNELIRQDAETTTVETTPDAAREAGALMFFGEKYGDMVRMLRIGPSLELCGGTHVDRTGRIGAFRVVSETAIAKGVRRIEAVTGRTAVEWSLREHHLAQSLASRLRSAPEEALQRLDALFDEKKALEKELDKLRQEVARLKLSAASGGSGAAVAQGPVRRIGPADATDPKLLRELANEQFAAAGPNALVVAAAPTADGKLSFIIACGPLRIEAGVKANEIAATLAREFGGRGGGKADMAQGGAPDGAQVEALLQRALALAGESIS